MKIEKTYNPLNQTMDISEAISEEINFYWRDSGKLENVESTADNCAGAIGRLIELLHTKNLLNDDDVMSFLTSNYKKVEE